jgi:hypothetical protein
MLEPGWVSAHHDEFDLFHVHFGFDAISPAALREVNDELARHGKPLVYTVHDLRNPHHRDAAVHVEQQSVLIEKADQLITLTPGAAAQIHRRWGRDAEVLPHPHVLEPDRIRQPRRRDERFVIGVHVKSLRANMDPLPVIDALAEIVATLPDAVVQVDVHDEIFEPDDHWYAPEIGAALLHYRRFPHVDVRVHPYFTDAELWEYLASLTVSVLPYRFGTHSGWLEACFDLGTAVIAPSCGFYDQQHPCGVFTFTEDEFDSGTLRGAVVDEHRRWSSGIAAPRANWSGRRQERAAIAAAHSRVYRSLST